RSNELPQRTGRTVKVEGGPQGEDGFVVVKRMTVEESTAFGKLFTKVQDKDSDEQEMTVRQAVADVVLEWNWVDDNGDPLPKPHGNVEVVGKLLNVELEWLFQAIAGTTDGQKKDLKPMQKPS